MLVLIQPGSIALTRMPCSPTTAPSAFTHIEIPPLVAQYADWNGAPTWAEIELTHTIAPPWPSLTICLAASVVTTQVPRRLVSDRLFQSSMVVSSHFRNGLIAEFETRRSRRPPRLATSWT